MVLEYVKWNRYIYLKTPLQLIAQYISCTINSLYKLIIKAHWAQGKFYIYYVFVYLQIYIHTLICWNREKKYFFIIYLIIITINYLFKGFDNITTIFSFFSKFTVQHYVINMYPCNIQGTSQIVTILKWWQQCKLHYLSTLN